MDEYFNWGGLLEKYYNEEKILKEIIKMFIDDLEKNLVQIKDINDIDKIRFIVHKTKGSAYNILANKLGDISKEIQDLCDKKSDIKLIKDKINNYIEISRFTIDSMKKYLE